MDADLTRLMRDHCKDNELFILLSTGHTMNYNKCATIKKKVALGQTASSLATILPRMVQTMQHCDNEAFVAFKTMMRLPDKH